MNMTGFRTRSIATACMLALGSVSGIAAAQLAPERPIVAEPPVAAGAAIADKTDAIAQINKATRVVNEMKRDADAGQLLRNAHGVFVVTNYARAGLGVGVRGGEGVLMINQNGSWSNPAFYDFGGISAGLQAGAEAGSLVMVLNNEKAVQSFMQENNWSLNADAGLTVLAWSERAKGEAGTGDIVIWSNASGLMADVAASVTDISFDEEETGAFYGRAIALREIFTTNMGQMPHVANLKQALSGGAGQSTGGAGDVDAVITVVPVVPADQGGASAGSGMPQQGTTQGGAAQGGASQDNTGTSGGEVIQPLEKYDDDAPSSGATSGTWQASTPSGAGASGQSSGAAGSTSTMPSGQSQ